MCVGVGVGQAIYTEVVCWIRTSLHRLPTRGTPRDTESSTLNNDTCHYNFGEYRLAYFTYERAIC